MKREPLTEAEAEQLLDADGAAVCSAMNISAREMVASKERGAPSGHAVHVLLKTGMGDDRKYVDADDESEKTPFTECDECQSTHKTADHRGTLAACEICEDVHANQHDRDDDEEMLDELTN